ADGHTLITGAPAEDNGTINQAGTVRAYDYDTISGQWIQRGQTFRGSTNLQQLGRSVDISADGNRIVYITRYGGSFGDGTFVVYDWNGGTGQWEQVGNVYNNSNGGSGNGIAISGDG